LKINADVKMDSVLVCRHADISGDGQIGVEEAMSILSQISRNDM
jgi:hypothetical protein